MKYLFCYTYQHPVFGVSHGDAITKVPDYLTEEALNNVRATIAKQLHLPLASQVSFTSVVQLAA